MIMKKLLILFLAFTIIGCPPVIDNGDTDPTDTTATDSIPVDTVITDTTVIDTTITDTLVTDTIIEIIDTTEADTTVTDTTGTIELIDIIEADTTVTDTVFDPTIIKEDRNKYETDLNKEKKRSYFQLYWKCPACNENNYNDFNQKMEGDKQKFTRQCLNLECLKHFEIKRKKDYFEQKEIYYE